VEQQSGLAVRAGGATTHPAIHVLVGADVCVRALRSVSVGGQAQTMPGIPALFAIGHR
jgi:hypothetical protein